MHRCMACPRHAWAVGRACANHEDTRGYLATTMVGATLVWGRDKKWMTREQSMRQLNVGLFGYGFIAKAHMAGLRRIPEARVVGVCGPHLERAADFAREWSIPHVTDEATALLALPRLDAVLIDSPDGTH